MAIATCYKMFRHSHYDGDHPTKSLVTPPNDLAQAKESRVAREVHAIVRNHLNKSDSEQSNSSTNYPGFVYLLEQNPKGKISYMHHPIKLKVSAFQQVLLQRI